MLKDIILASASPRRKELLSVITSEFEVIPSEIEEIVPDDIDVLEQAEYLSFIKAEDVAKNNPLSVVIGADTCVVVGNKILGKPKDKYDAENMLKLLSGKVHQVVTGCTVFKGNRVESFSVVTDVEFFDLSENEIEKYINSNEPYDKAGAYAIQGKASLFVKEIKGDYFNVVGLPISQLNRVLRSFLDN